MVSIFTGVGAGFTRGSGNLLGGAGQLGGSLLGRGGEGVSVNAATGNLLISHQEAYNAFALFVARPLEGAGWSEAQALLIGGIGIVSTLLTALLLLHPRSPLKVNADLG